ncbi:MAG: DNA-binding protein Alba [Candidatus Woesearchaeota archaeon]
MATDNQIYIGKKNFMNYVTAVVMQFTTKNASEVIVRARGKFISRAIDIVEVARKRFLEGKIDIDKINIGSEEFQNKDGKKVRVSTIEIILKKKQ